MLISLKDSTASKVVTLFKGSCFLTFIFDFSWVILEYVKVVCCYYSVRCQDV